VHVSPLVWWLTIGITTALLVFDVFVIGRRPHEPSRREVTLALAGFVGLAIAFGIGVFVFSGSRYGTEFFAGWLTEYSLSVDNLFIFLIIMSKFGVPRAYQQTALLIGIVIALVMRGIFIAVGAAAINNISWIFYVFGAFLIYTAIKQAMPEGEHDDDVKRENFIVRLLRRRIDISETYDGSKLRTTVDGKRMWTPMVIVFITIGVTDLIFAIDSIPAIFEITTNGFLVFAANIFALMGLRQLYFLIGGLLQRLVYLSYGLAFLLGFIGVKLILHALHENELPFINGGEHVEWVPDIDNLVSLGVIVVSMTVATVASLIAASREKSAAKKTAIVE
jgi:tellurite resistance protein TerC